MRQRVSMGVTSFAKTLQVRSSPHKPGGGGAKCTKCYGICRVLIIGDQRRSKASDRRAASMSVGFSDIGKGTTTNSPASERDIMIRISVCIGCRARLILNTRESGADLVCTQERCIYNRGIVARSHRTLICNLTCHTEEERKTANAFIAARGWKPVVSYQHPCWGTDMPWKAPHTVATRSYKSSSIRT